MKKLIYLLVGISLLNGACNKEDTLFVDETPKEEEEIELPFHVQLKTEQAFKAGDRVEFTLEGNPESIEFFSGQTGQQYEYRDGRPQPSGMNLNFGLHTPNPDLSTSSLYLLVSTDFDGDVSTFEEVSQQNWLDVSDRIQHPTVPNAYANVGPIDLSDLTVIGKPFYFAIKHVNMLNSSGGVFTWTIRTPTWNSILPDFIEQIGAIATVPKSDPVEYSNTLGFKVVYENTSKKSTVSNGQAAGVIGDRFGITGHKDTPGAETWIISKQFNGVQEIMGDKDTSIPIKSAGNSSLSNYSHVYTIPGTYKAHFVATVLNEEGERTQEIKEVEIVIEP